jgi:CysZ protein
MNATSCHAAARQGHSGVDSVAGPRDPGAQMLSALTLALGQLGDPRVLRILARSLAVTLVLFAGLATAGWYGLDAALARFGLGDGSFEGAGSLRGLVALAITLIGGWLLWRILALAVLQFYADEVVKAVEARHYPDRLASARELRWQAELALGMRGVLRALGYNLIALPFAAALLVTGVGTALVFWAVNAVLLGRELVEMVWVRHRSLEDKTLPLRAGERFALGGLVAALLAIPFANLLAPFLGAAMATHLVHRKGANGHAA